MRKFFVGLNMKSKHCQYKIGNFFHNAETQQFCWRQETTSDPDRLAALVNEAADYLHKCAMPELVLKVHSIEVPDEDETTEQELPFDQSTRRLKRALKPVSA